MKRWGVICCGILCFVRLFAESPVTRESFFQQMGFSMEGLSHREKVIDFVGVFTLTLTGTRDDVEIMAMTRITKGGNTDNDVYVMSKGKTHTLIVSCPKYGVTHLEIYARKKGESYYTAPFLIYDLMVGYDREKSQSEKIPEVVCRTLSNTGQPLKIPSDYERGANMYIEEFSHPNRYVFVDKDFDISFPAPEDMDVRVTMDAWEGDPRTLNGMYIDTFDGWPTKWRDQRMLYVEHEGGKARIIGKPSAPGTYRLDVRIKPSWEKYYRNFIRYEVFVRQGNGGKMFPVPDAAERQTDRNYDYSAIDKHASQVPAAEEATLERLVAYLIRPARNEREKARTVYTWIVRNIKYDVPERGEDMVNAGSCFITRVGVCDDYADLFETMAREAGLKCRYAAGMTINFATGKESTVHAWNEVMVDGKWRLVDSTWGVSDPNKWFLSDPAEFAKTHKLRRPQDYGLK